MEQKLPEFLRSNFLTGERGRKTIFDISDGNFQDELEKHFGLGFESTSPHTLFSTFLNYMDSKMSSRTQRYYTLRVFSQNLMAATLFASLISTFVAFRNLGNSEILLSSLLTILVLTLVFEVALVFSSVAYPLIDLLIIDYYIENCDRN